MSDYFNLNEGVKKAKRRFPKLGSILNKRFAPLIIIGIALPITVVLALTQQNLLKFASGPEIASVAIDPGVINTKTGSKPQPMSTLAYDSAGNPVFSGVAYEWSMSSTNSVGTLSRTQGEITEFFPLKYGCGQITVIARSGNQNITKSVAVSVANSNGSPNCTSTTPTPTPSAQSADFKWETNYASLDVKGAYIEVEGKRYLIDQTNLRIVSSPTTLFDGYYYTTLEGTWIEKGVEMRMFMYFRYKSGSFWQLYLVRTYDGTNNNDWIFYSGHDQFDQPLMNEIGSKYIGGPIDMHSLPQEPGESIFKGKIHFDTIVLGAFLDLKMTPTPSDTLTPTPTSPPSPSPTPAPIPGDFDGDGTADIKDFNIWRDEFLEISIEKKSDVNKDGKIDLVDYIIWRNHF